MIRPAVLPLAFPGPRARRLIVTAALLSTAAIGCGGSAARSGDAAGPLSARPASPATSRTPAAPATAGALSLVPASRDAQTRLAYADLERLNGSDLPLPAATVSAAVLGDDAGDADITVGDARRAFRAGPPPERSAITPEAQAAVQSCLGDALAQTILGPEAMGTDSAIGAGLAASSDPPKGVQLRICAAPLYVRDLHDTERALQRRIGAVPGAVIEERENGERAMLHARVPAARLDAADVRDLVAGGRRLTTLAPWR